MGSLPEAHGDFFPHQSLSISRKEVEGQLEEVDNSNSKTETHCLLFPLSISISRKEREGQKEEIIVI